ncbi:VaFE repeat-containing surface-anchored protein, partial [Fannyhessea vaginae]|uniref:VaFE repeat-containing surface-anchored protein n=1 Tax=Fannyhessea vaginae TaxID=82135 RepID=UPI000792A62B
GEINTSSEFVKHSYKTNQNDSALNANGTCDATKLVMDTGVWFGGTSDTEDGAKVCDTLGALPYDTYTIQELSSPQNKGKKLISFDIQLTRPHYNLILGTINNKPAESFISELLSTNLNHSAYTEEKTTLTDTLSFENLNVGATYIVSGYLVDKDTGVPLQDAQGKDIRVEKTFTARIASDRVKLVYTFNAKDLNGKSVVAFATLKDKDGNIICSEKDLSESDQSVSFTNPPAPPTTPPDEPPTPPVTPPDEPPVVPSDKPGAPLAKTSDMLQLGLGLLALGAGIGLISYGIYRKRKKRV